MHDADAAAVHPTHRTPTPLTPPCVPCTTEPDSRTHRRPGADPSVRTTHDRDRMGPNPCMPPTVAGRAGPTPRALVPVEAEARGPPPAVRWAGARSGSKRGRG